MQWVTFIILGFILVGRNFLLRGKDGQDVWSLESAIECLLTKARSRAIFVRLFRTLLGTFSQTTIQTLT